MVLLRLSECESLVRKMLVLDPERRYTIDMIKKHSWMQAEVPANEKARHEAAAKDAGSPSLPGALTGRKCDTPLNESVLKLIKAIGLDPNITREVSRKAIRQQDVAFQCK